VAHTLRNYPDAKKVLRIVLKAELFQKLLEAILRNNHQASNLTIALLKYLPTIEKGIFG